MCWEQMRLIYALSISLLLFLKFFAFIIPVIKHKKAAKTILIATFSSLGHVSVDIRHLSPDVLVISYFCQINKVAAA